MPGICIVPIVGETEVSINTIYCVADSHSIKQGGHSQAGGADASAERADMEHLTADEFSTATGDVHGVVVVDAVRGWRAGTPTAGSGARAAA